MIYLISDLHGYPFERFTELLQRAGFSDDDLLYVLGDVVDRGEDGVRYLLWLKKQKNIELLLGNHELMMRKCDFLFSPDAPELMGNLDREQKIRLGLWMSNGAKPTLSGLFGISQEERGAFPLPERPADVPRGDCRRTEVSADAQRAARFRAAKSARGVFGRGLCLEPYAA